MLPTATSMPQYEVRSPARGVSASPTLSAVPCQSGDGQSFQTGLCEITISRVAARTKVVRLDYCSGREASPGSYNYPGGRRRARGWSDLPPAMMRLAYVYA